VNLSIHKGLAMAHLDRARHGATDGLALATQHLMYWRAAGTQAMVPYFLGQLGEAHHFAGDDAAALTLLDEAIALGEKTGEHLHDAELYRVRGLAKLSGRAGDRSTGLDDLFKAAASAAAQRAVSFEIRSIVGLLSAVPDLDDRGAWIARLEDAIRRLESNEHGPDEREARSFIASEQRENRVRS
jgi:predicted ATPase